MQALRGEDRVKAPSPTPSPRPNRALRVAAAVGGAIAILLLFWRGQPLRPSHREATYSELMAAVADGKVKEAEISARDIRARLTTPEGDVKDLLTERIPNMDERTMLEAMQAHAVVVKAKQEGGWGTAFFALAPWLGIMLLVWLGSGLLGGGAGRARPLTFGRSRAKLYDRAASDGTTFSDVAGVDDAKAELVEVVQFLKEPARYRAVGARIPKGVLLVGAPGTGKTLLARAVAGEAGVPFFSLSGSEFVEMFVGVGASRVRDLFEQAKERAPCIIFIDELDAVGKARSGVQGFASNEEREQTLNQLLVEMDGFDPGSGLIIMAATNRPEILDRALLRAGRFDRQVVVDRPDVRGREAILKVHARRVALGPSVDLAVVAQRTSGMVGADLANVVNEAALASVRRGGKAIESNDFDEAMDRIQLGLKKEGRVMTDADKRRVAIHETGHALVALTLEHVDPVHRVSIIPRSIGALGMTLQLPTQERYLLTQDELRDRICVLFGGRVAERIVLGDLSTGAEDDLSRATEMARQMVCRFGMSDIMGARTLEPGGAGPWLHGAGALYPAPEPTTSDETRREADEEIRRLLDEQQARARRLLEQVRPALDAIAAELIQHETLDHADLVRLVPPLVRAA